MSKYEFTAVLDESEMNVRVDTSSKIGWSAPIKNKIGRIIGKVTIVDAGGNCEVEIEQGSVFVPPSDADYRP